MFLKRVLPLAIAFVGLNVSATFAQHDHQQCATVDAEQLLLEENPWLKPIVEQAHAELEAHYQDFIKHQKRDDPDFIIPVVFHVLYDFGPERITAEQIHDALRIINADFNKENSDIGDVAPAFINIAGDAKIEFRLAQIDPDGNPTGGIEWIKTQETYVGDDGSKLNPWPRDKYLNIWTASEVGVANAAAYAFRPGSVATANQAAVDGILTNHTYVGSIGTGSQGSSSRTLTHEIGHYLNLMHPWGNSNDPLLPDNCNMDDEVLDTPNTVGNQTCNLNAESCGSLDNVQNFMDYASCENMFTDGQVSRMHATLNSTVADRENLWQQANLAATGVIGVQTADFTAELPVVCVGEEYALTDRSFYDQKTWNWNFFGAGGDNSTQDTEVTFYGPGLKNIGLTVSDGTNTDTQVKEGFALAVPMIGQYIPATNDFELDAFPNDSWIAGNEDRDEFGWERIEGAGFGGTTGMRMKNQDNVSSTVDYLYSSTYDLSPLNSVTITFRVAFAQQFADDNDLLFLYGSADCGQTWTPIWFQSGSSLATVDPTFTEFVPAGDNEWKQITVNNIPSTLFQENLQFRFAFQNDGGNHLYLDDFRINGTFNATPVLESPANFAMHQDANTLLNWKAVQDAEYYEFEMDEDITFISSSLVTGTNNYIDVSPLNEDTEFQTDNLSVGTTYYWRVRARVGGADSPWSPTWVFTVAANGVGINEQLEEEVGFKVVPNPIDYSGTLEFNVPSASHADLRVYDMLGQQVLTLEQGSLNYGKQVYNVPNGSLVPGLYMAKLVLGNHEFTEKFVVR